MLRTSKTVVGAEYDTEVGYDEDHEVTISQGDSEITMPLSEAEDLLVALAAVVDEVRSLKA